MVQQRKRLLWKIGVAACLAMAIVVVAGASISLASGGNDSGNGLRSAVVPIRKSPEKPRNQNPGQESNRVKLLVRMRDPFKVPPPPHLGGSGDGLDGPLPPGVRGLVIGRLQLKGIVREDASNSMIAVVMDRRNLAYFLRVHDEVYNGVVSGITPDSIRFVEKRLSADGQDESRQVVLKLGSEQQEAR